jgi:hypothetical protein
LALRSVPVFKLERGFYSRRLEVFQLPVDHYAGQRIRTNMYKQNFIFNDEFKIGGFENLIL